MAAATPPPSFREAEGVHETVFLDLAEGVPGEVFDDADFARALVVGERLRAESRELLEERVR